jgi:phosphate transport system protein
MERQFDQQLEKLKTRILKMCSLVDEQVDIALRSIDEGNAELANLVIEREKKVDKYDLKIDKICQKIFALNQPVAMDLRLIMSALAISSNLERMGDIAVNIAENSLMLEKKPDFMNRIHFPEMSKIAREMIRNSIDSFIQDDANLAKKVIEMDSTLDKFNKENHQILINVMKENQDNIQPAVVMLVTSRQIERLGDHSTNIAEDVYFIVEARMVKHKYEKYLFSQDTDEDDEEEELKKQT